MARAYSQDLRDRVIDAALAGAPARQAAARFGIGNATAIVWVRRARQRGERTARKQGQPRRCKLDPHRDYILGLILRAGIPHCHWRTTTFVAGLRLTGMVAPMVLHGPINGHAFQAYVDQVLVPELRPGDIVIMDNLASHKGRAVRAARQISSAASVPTIHREASSKACASRERRRALWDTMRARSSAQIAILRAVDVSG